MFEWWSSVIRCVFTSSQSSGNFVGFSCPSMAKALTEYIMGIDITQAISNKDALDASCFVVCEKKITSAFTPSPPKKAYERHRRATDLCESLNPRKKKRWSHNQSKIELVKFDAAPTAKTKLVIAMIANE